jgi:hypothetical protein
MVRLTPHMGNSSPSEFRKDFYLIQKYQTQVAGVGLNWEPYTVSWGRSEQLSD